METGIDVDIPVSKSGSLTTATVFKVTHFWTIENFTFYLEDKILKSATFSAEGFDGIQWSIELLPHGGNEEKNAYVSLYLSLDSCDRNEIRVAYTFSILNSRLENIMTWRSSRPRLFEAGESWGFEYFVEKDCILKHLTELANDELNVCCELMVLVDPVNFSGWRGSSKLPQKTVSVDLRVPRQLSDVAATVSAQELQAQEPTHPSDKPIEVTETPTQTPSSSSDSPKGDDSDDKPSALEGRAMPSELSPDQLKDTSILGPDEEVERLKTFRALNGDPRLTQEPQMSLHEKMRLLNDIGFCLKCGRHNHVSEISGSQIRCPHQENDPLEANRENDSSTSCHDDESDSSLSWSTLSMSPTR